MKLGSLEYIPSIEEGRVKINWNKMPESVVLLDTLQDWICELEEVYEAKREEVFKQGESK